MITKKPSSLSNYLTSLLSAGKAVFTRDDATKALGISAGAFHDAAERMQRRGNLFSPKRGLYVVVPPQFHAWGAPPPAWYIDDLMQREGRPYYVGLLKAAELHGVAHHAVMEFQVITDKRLAKIHAGRSIISFYYRKDMSAISAGIEDRKTETGKMRISSPELTSLDIVRYPRASGGLDTINLVINELAEKLNPKKLAALAPAFERTVVQRLGFLLDHLGYSQQSEVLQSVILQGGPIDWVELDPIEASDRELSHPPINRDQRWHVVIRQLPQADQ